VTATPEIVTVSSEVPRKSPIVTTGPPPLITVAFAPAPTRSTLLSIVMPPAKLPGPTLIVSPSSAASSASWIVA
jgi:hypothetical protein